MPTSADNATAKAPCTYQCDEDLCQECDGQGNCESWCDALQCLECDGQGNCEVCGGDPDKHCCDGQCCPDDKCCVDGQCITGHCIPMWETDVLIECTCSAPTCSGIRTLEYHWYCAENYYGDGDCPPGTDCVQTGWEVCYKYWTYGCTGTCETSGSECGVVVPPVIIKEPRVLCGCCPP